MKYTAALRIVLTFLLLIAAGTLLLYLFGLLGEQEKPEFLVALFTAVSAVCVTGLSVIDISARLSLTGQIILLCLIQAGGLGLLTLSNWVLLSVRGKVSVHASMTTRDTLGKLSKMPAGRFLRNIVLFTFGAELLGALPLFIGFNRTHPVSESLWLAVFHSVSAFCNAGFSLFSDSLMYYDGDLLINVTIMALILAGGLGYVAGVDIVEWFTKRKNPGRRRLMLHTKTVLYTSSVLLGSGFIFFLIFEWSNPVLHDSIPNKMLESLFLSVTARTAGFNTIDTSQLTNISLIMLMVFMFIGASPGSTGGGIKTTSAAVLWGLIRSHLFNRDRVELFNRSVAQGLVARVIAIVLLQIGIIVIATIVLQITEFGEMPHELTRGQYLEQVFEVVSAISTVGLSTGITTKLSSAGLVVLMLCMYIGRVGTLVLAAVLIGERPQLGYDLPEEDVMVG